MRVNVVSFFLTLLKDSREFRGLVYLSLECSLRLCSHWSLKTSLPKEYLKMVYEQGLEALGKVIIIIIIIIIIGQQRNNGDLFSDPDLHTTLTQEQQLNNGDQERCSFLEPANRIMETISTHPGDYSQRDIDTRTKETPSTKDLEEINQAIKLLMERYEVTPTQNPFGFLWLANCALYSVVCAFLLMKGWKKQGPIKRDNPQDRKEKLKRIYDQEVVKIRSNQKTTVNRKSGNRKVERK